MSSQKSNDHTHQHHVYVLRLWQEHDPVADKPDPQRIILENPQTGARHRFHSLVELCAFLETVNRIQFPD